MQQKGIIKQWLPYGRDQWLIYICCLTVFVGFSCSRAMMSIGLIGLMVTGLIFSDFRKTIITFSRRSSYYILSLYFFVILFSYLNSENKHLWLNFLRIKLPFLILPLAFCGMDVFDKAFVRKILFVFALSMTISAVFVMVNYLLHYQEINYHIGGGGIIPTPFSHIRYSLLLVFAFFVWLWLFYTSPMQILSAGYLFLIPSLFLLIVIHVLPSRSAWVALYAGLICYLVAYISRQRQYLLGFAMIVLICAMPFILYRLVPSFKNKVGYTLYTWSQYRQGHVDDMSDGMRFSSWKVGAEIIRRNFWTGVGVGDLQQESLNVSHQLFPNIQKEDDRKMPHNEFMWIWAATGFFGFMAYCIAFLLPLAATIRRADWLFGVFHVLFFTSFMSESSLEEQVGTAFYLLFLLIFLNYFNHQATISE